MRLGIGPGAHNFFYFVFGHLMFSQCNIVAKESSAKLIGDEDGKTASPCDSKNHVKGDAEGAHSSQLVVSAQMVDGCTAESQPVKSHSEGQVSRILFFLLRK